MEARHTRTAARLRPKHRSRIGRVEPARPRSSGLPMATPATAPSGGDPTRGERKERKKAGRATAAREEEKQTPRRTAARPRERREGEAPPIQGPENFGEGTCQRERAVDYLSARTQGNAKEKDAIAAPPAAAAAPTPEERAAAAKSSRATASSEQERRRDHRNGAAPARREPGALPVGAPDHAREEGTGGQKRGIDLPGRGKATKQKPSLLDVPFGVPCAPYPGAGGARGRPAPASRHARRSTIPADASQR